MSWTDTDISELFRAISRLESLLKEIVKQGEGILSLAEEVEKLKERVGKLGVQG